MTSSSSKDACDAFFSLESLQHFTEEAMHEDLAKKARQRALHCF